MFRAPRIATARRPAAICVAGILALALAMGIGRFAFTPMMPLMIRDQQLTQAGGSWLAAANYLGYLIGALGVRSLAVPATRQIQASLLGIVVATAGMAATQSPVMWALLRFAAGVLSASALVATSVWALHALARAQRPSLAGIVYSGVGLGIAAAGAYCLLAATPGATSATLWLGLGAFAGLLAAAALILMAGLPPDAEPPGMGRPVRGLPRGCGQLVLCYGIFGFGYILPATFLPALARNLVDDPRRFGLAWPVFGLAAALSVVLLAWLLPRANRLKVWSVCSVLMAIGAMLPSVLGTLASISLAALLVGGTFMIVTVVGFQEARVRLPTAPAALIGWMTAAFALGQILGPLLPTALTYLQVPPPLALDEALQTAAAALVISAAVLWRLASKG